MNINIGRKWILQQIEWKMHWKKHWAPSVEDDVWIRQKERIYLLKEAVYAEDLLYSPGPDKKYKYFIYFKKIQNHNNSFLFW